MIKKEIIKRLKEGRAVLVPVETDLAHYDILFTPSADVLGEVQGGLKSSDLFVSIKRWGGVLVQSW